LTAAKQKYRGAYLPWAPHTSADDARRLRAELCNVIEALSTLEGLWLETLDEVLARAMRRPLSDLLPNLH